MRLSLPYLSFLLLLTSCTFSNNENPSKNDNTSLNEPLTESSNIDTPTSPQEGDSQTVTQTRESVRSTYRQVYQAGRWVTKSVKKQFVEQP